MKYISFFKLRFSTGLQYRAAAIAGIVTQFTWGAMEILVFHSFYRSNPDVFPMELTATSSYIWMQQAFLALFMTWFLENDVFDSIVNGNVAYELCRPISIYNMWFSRSMATRLSKAVLRCFPILIFAALLPSPYGLEKPSDLTAAFWFFITMILGFLVTVALCMLAYILCFFTISPMGVRMVFVSLTEFLTGSVLPIPFFPDKLRRILELLPFASMQNVPLRVYSGDLAGTAMKEAILLQIFWLIVLVLGGKALTYAALKQITLQGG